MTDVKDEYRIPKLTDNNYHVWNVRAKAALVQKSLWEAIDPGYGPELSATSSAKNSKALTYLFIIVDDDILEDIEDCTRAKDAWEILEEQYSKVSLIHKLHMIRELFTIDKKDEETMKEYLSRITSQHRMIKKCGYGFLDNELGLIMLMGLPAEYEQLIINLEQQEDTITAKEVKRKLLLEEKKLNRRKEKSVDESEGTRALKSYSKTKLKSDEKPNWSKTNNDESATLSNQAEFRESSENRSQQSRHNVRCFCCKKFGHIARNCYYNKFRTSSNYVTPGPNRYAKSQQRNDEPQGSKTDDGKSNEYKRVSYNPSLKALCTRHSSFSDKNTWYLDTAANEHMSPYIEKFKTLDKFDSTVIVADGIPQQVMGKGDIEINLTENSGNRTLLLTNVLYVPQLEDNLLSLGKTTEKGLEIILKLNDLKALDENGAIVFESKRDGRLYKVYEHEPEEIKGMKVTLEIMHRRLGHVSMTKVRETMKDNVVTENKTPSEICDVCIKGKNKKKPFPEGQFKSSHKLELVHSDVVGPIQPASKGGAKYVVTFTDDYTRYSEVYFMKTKDEVLQKFMQYKAMVEVQSGLKIQILRTDNGREYVNKAFNDYLQTEGITRQLTVPYNPQQNGVSERQHQSLFNITRCVMIESGAPRHLWAEALNTANHIRNRCSSVGNGGNIPYTMWYERTPNYDEMRVFGCRAWMFIEKEKRCSKLDERAKECIFVGYQSGVKGYKLWDRNEDKFFLSRDVYFEENIFPMKAGSTNAISESESPITLDIFLDQNNRQESALEPSQVSLNREGKYDHTSCNQGQGRESEHTSRNQGSSININNRKIYDDERGETELKTASEQGSSTSKNKQKRGDNEKGERELRRSSRIKEQKAKAESLNQTGCKIVATKEKESLILNEVLESDPQTLNEALNSKDAQHWKEAIDKELAALEANHTWEVIEKPDHVHTIQSKWVFKKKKNENGEITEYKARLVARGFQQIQDIEYSDVFSPVIKMKAVRLLLATAAQRKWKVYHFDITSAYLNGDLEETILMESPEIGDGKLLYPNKVCRLKKGLYGLKQGGRQWNKKLDEFLRSIGLKQSEADPCVYFNEDRSLILGVHVDDIILISENDELYQEFANKISEKFQCKNLGEASHLLSMRINRNEDGSIQIDQEHLIEELLKHFRMEEARPASTPLDKSVKFKREENTCRSSELPYRKLIGSLMYLANATRPDICYAVGYLSQFNDIYEEKHWVAAKHVLRYLKGTKDWKLTYRPVEETIEGFSDADWGSDPMDRKSTHGYVFRLADGAVTWCSRKQRSVALSSTEAELLAMVQATKEVLWLMSFLTEIGDPITSIVMYVDNQEAISMANNKVISERNKHIEIANFFVRDIVEKKKVSYVYKPTEVNVADIMTKTTEVEKQELF